MRRSAAAASEPHAAQAARDALIRGNAVDAVVAGVLVAAAEHAGVLLGPLQLIVGGAGAGLRALDGRVRQPGLGVPRPRGLLAGNLVPTPARVGVPLMPASMALVLAALGSATLSRVASGVVERARGRSAERARVFEVLARRGASALVEESIAAELTAVAGRSARGSLTEEDLSSVRPALLSCHEGSLGAGVLTVPWRAVDGADASCTQVVAAADARGLVAVGCYENSLEGLPVPALGLIAPSFAAPVLRAEPRVRPGEPCPAAAPIAVRAARGIVDVAIGFAEAAGAEASLDSVLAALAETPTILAALARGSSGRPVALLRVADEVLVFASG